MAVAMIGYHYSPARNHDSIRKHGLLVPTGHPKLVTPVVCSEGHRNPHISLGRSPRVAWELSGGFLNRWATERGVDNPHKFVWWNLWEVDLGARSGYSAHAVRYHSNGFELQVRTDIAKHRMSLVGQRWGED